MKIKPAMYSIKVIAKVNTRMTVMYLNGAFGIQFAHGKEEKINNMTLPKP